MTLKQETWVFDWFETCSCIGCYGNVDKSWNSFKTRSCFSPIKVIGIGLFSCYNDAQLEDSVFECVLFTFVNAAGSRRNTAYHGIGVSLCGDITIFVSGLDLPIRLDIELSHQHLTII